MRELEKLFAEVLGQAFPDEPDGVQANTGLLENLFELLQLSLRKFYFLRSDMVVHLPRRNEPINLGLHLQGHRLAGFGDQTLTLLLGEGLSRLEHSRNDLAADFPIFQQLPG